MVALPVAGRNVESSGYRPAENGTPVNLKVEKTSLIRAIEALRSQTRYNFLFNSKDLQPYTDISVHLQSVTLQPGAR